MITVGCKREERQALAPNTQQVILVVNTNDLFNDPAEKPDLSKYCFFKGQATGGILKEFETVIDIRETRYVRWLGVGVPGGVNSLEISKVFIAASEDNILRENEITGQSGMVTARLKRPGSLNSGQTTKYSLFFKITRDGVTKEYEIDPKMRVL